MVAICFEKRSAGLAAGAPLYVCHTERLLNDLRGDSLDRPRSGTTELTVAVVPPAIRRGRCGGTAVIGAARNASEHEVRRGYFYGLLGVARTVVITEFAVAVVAPTVRLAGREQAARVRSASAQSAPCETTENGYGRGGANQRLVPQLPLVVPSPTASWIARIRTDAACVKCSGRD